MKRILLTALLIVTANTVAATSLSIKHNKDLPTPYELITKGTILHKLTEDDGDPTYYIAWDKTEDIYTCVINRFYAESGKNISSTRCANTSQMTDLR